MAYVIRPIKESDFEFFKKFAFQAALGITNLPKNEERLKEHLELAVNSFSKSESNQKAFYLFALEESESKKVGGICGIFSRTGNGTPFYYYNISSVKLQKTFKESSDEIAILEPIVYTSGPSEICSLYLDFDFRKEGLGKLLSLSRFHFIASFRERFTDTIFAEMRGYIDSEGNSPFWNVIGRTFLDIDFKTLMAWRDSGVQVAPHIFPKYPIYIPFLPSSAKEVIGKVHPNTEPALHMLLKQGFSFSQEIDFYDAGPKITVETDEIQTIKESQLKLVTRIEKLSPNTKSTLISNTRFDFRACYGALSIESDGLILDEEAAKLLEVNKGDKIRFT